VWCARNESMCSAMLCGWRRQLAARLSGQSSQVQWPTRLFANFEGRNPDISLGILLSLYTNCIHNTLRLFI
jgi:hypothetical protein